MAAYSVGRSKHATLTGTTVDTVTIDSGNLAEEVPYKSVAVFNREAAGGADLWVTIDGSTPVALADNTDIVPAGTEVEIPLRRRTAAGITVKILGNGNDYSVRGVPE